MFEGRPDRTDEVVLVGRSNVGKSTLMRELTGHDVATGSSPGVTRSPNHYDWAGPDFVLTDLPGFGFMSGVPAEVREEIKTDVVRYVEDNADAIRVAILVVDGTCAVEIIDRHSGEDEVPYVVDMYGFLLDLGLPTVVAVNKTDKIDDRDVDDTVDDLCARLGLHPPWQQWRDRVAPISAKRGSIDALTDAVGEHLRDQRRDDLLQFF
ncbi:GTP-binding protein [Halobacteriales archaeon SW_7_68_16]|nr:MAG: GTP-binding protein [Halobacteriales archaeon SW_7_68_16]